MIITSYTLINCCTGLVLSTWGLNPNRSCCVKKASSHGALRHSGQFWLCQLLYALFDIKASKKLWGQVGNESWSPYLNHQTAEICRASVSAGYSSDGDDFSACFIFSRTYFIQMRTFIRSANDTAIHNLTGNNSPPILFITLIGNLICSELFIGFYIIFHYCYKYYISFFQSLIVFKFLKLFFFFFCIFKHYLRSEQVSPGDLVGFRNCPCTSVFGAFIQELLRL